MSQAPTQLCGPSLPDSWTEAREQLCENAPPGGHSFYLCAVLPSSRADTLKVNLFGRPSRLKLKGDKQVGVECRGRSAMLAPETLLGTSGTDMTVCVWKLGGGKQRSGQL